MYLRGEVYNVTTSGATIATLPTGYRPSVRMGWLVPRDAVSAVTQAAAIVIDTDGTIHVSPAVVGAAVTTSPGTR